MWIKGRLFVYLYIKSNVPNCQDILNLLLLCGFDQSYTLGNNDTRRCPPCIHMRPLTSVAIVAQVRVVVPGPFVTATIVIYILLVLLIF